MVDTIVANAGTQAADWFASEGGQAHVGRLNRRRLQPVEGLDGIMLNFASDASAWTTGATMTVDDGQSL